MCPHCDIIFLRKNHDEMTQTATASVELLSFGAVAVRRKLANEQTDERERAVRE